MKEAARYTFRGGRGALSSKRPGKLINRISERFVNAPCSYQEANYRYQPALYLFRIIRLITKLSPSETKLSLCVRTKPVLSANDTVSEMDPISICSSQRSSRDEGSGWIWVVHKRVSLRCLHAWPTRRILMKNVTMTQRDLDASFWRR